MLVMDWAVLWQFLIVVCQLMRDDLELITQPAVESDLLEGIDTAQICY